MQVLRLRLYLLALFVLTGAISYSPSQLIAQSNSSIHSAPMPDARFYSLNFRHILYLHNNDVQSGILDVPAGSKGPHEGDLDRYYRDRIKASAPEESSFLAEAQAWAAEVAPVDAQAHNIVTSIRALTLGGQLAPGEQPPAPPQSLVDLQKQRDAITLKHMSNLRTAFGDQRFTQLDDTAHRVAHLTFQTGALNGHTNPMANSRGNQ